MNQEKAREFFSAYYEDSLEAGLRQTFEQRLRSDAQLQAEYRSFEETMAQLDNLKYEEIEVPVYLSDRIATRLEQVQEKQRAKTPIWTIWMRGLALGGVATLAIFGAVYGLKMKDGASQASIVAGQSQDPLKVSLDGRQVELTYRADEREAVVLSNGSQEVKRVVLEQKDQLNSELRNDLATTAMFEVKTADRQVWIAVPGTRPQLVEEGTGTMKDFASSLAGFYRVPVRLEVGDGAKNIVWAFNQSKPIDAAVEALDGAPYSVSELEDGVIQIKDR